MSPDVIVTLNLIFTLPFRDITIQWISHDLTEKNSENFLICRFESGSASIKAPDYCIKKSTLDTAKSLYVPIFDNLFAFVSNFVPLHIRHIAKCRKSKNVVKTNISQTQSLNNFRFISFKLKKMLLFWNNWSISVS